VSEKIWVTTDKGRTQGNWEYYAEADGRIRGIRNRFRKKKVTKDQVERAVRKITGQYRVDADWEKAIEGVKTPPGCDRNGTWGREMFEAWGDAMPHAYRRIYGSAEVITQFILEEK
jgi:hypothetical protein